MQPTISNKRALYHFESVVALFFGFSCATLSSSHCTHFIFPVIAVVFRAKNGLQVSCVWHLFMFFGASHCVDRVAIDKMFHSVKKRLPVKRQATAATCFHSLHRLIYCAECTSKSASLTASKKPVRVCDKCFSEVTSGTARVSDDCVT